MKVLTAMTVLRPIARKMKIVRITKRNRKMKKMIVMRKVVATVTKIAKKKKVLRFLYQQLQRKRKSLIRKIKRK